jgi:NADH dehydrogenase
MPFNIPDTDQKRVVIIGGGFGGMTLARELAGRREFQVVLIDKNNYYQFQPLFYQVAMAALEPSSIVFPFRKMFQGQENVYVRMTELQAVDAAAQQIETPVGTLRYDYLVLAVGADTNWYGNEQIRAHAIPMKSVSEALYIRNRIFEDYEYAVTASTLEERQEFLDIVIVGGGPTGVEIAGSLAEMKRHIIPKDYIDLERREIDIHLVHGNERLLNTMSEEASRKAEAYLRELGVNLWLARRVTGYDGETVAFQDGASLKAHKCIWAAGIVGNAVPGLPAETVASGNRIKVNAFNQVEGLPAVFAIGDIAAQAQEAYPDGHPQVAQVALQHAQLLARNLRRLERGEALQEFRYRDLGSMATIGRHRAVADLPYWKFQGAFAWFVWLFVHLFGILGAKNKLFVFVNWLSNYFTYDQSLRLVIKPWTRQ